MPFVIFGYNAGVVSGKSFLSTSDQQNILTMNVNAICHFWASGSEVKTTCVCPYFVATGMFEGVRSNVLPILQPDYVTKEVIAAILTDQEMIVLPQIGNLLIFLKALLPVKAINTVEKFLGVHETMYAFKGRHESAQKTK
ncbi:unnamed protein product [Notodromas monacha]|uniref:Uncharacterized protein n=1 Tax=Notodromas monacha TaxID=399045 RepID=A0A7R9BTN8_9CRUS|nr:unnamed protein product [Notodromas monacha]CAG0921548.1 unnamed protein product [Notodromas monacha]